MIIALFASNVFRIRQIIEIALKNNRKIVLNGRSIEQTVAIAKELGYLDWPEHMSLDLRKVNSFADNQVMVITTGSQGEPMSALARMATGFHKQLNIKKGDTVIPPLQNPFPVMKRPFQTSSTTSTAGGAEVVHDKIAKVHVSGHACRKSSN